MRDRHKYSSDNLNIPIGKRLPLNHVGSLYTEPIPPVAVEIKPYGINFGNREIKGRSCAVMMAVMTTALCAGMGYVVANREKIMETFQRITESIR